MAKRPAIGGSSPNRTCDTFWSQRPDASQHVKRRAKAKRLLASRFTSISDDDGDYETVYRSAGSPRKAPYLTQGPASRRALAGHLRRNAKKHAFRSPPNVVVETVEATTTSSLMPQAEKGSLRVLAQVAMFRNVLDRHGCG